MEIKKYDTYRGVLDEHFIRGDVMVVLTDTKNVEEPSKEDSEKYENFKKLERGEIIGVITYFPSGTNNASDIQLVSVDNFTKELFPLKDVNLSVIVCMIFLTNARI